MGNIAAPGSGGARITFHGSQQRQAIIKGVPFPAHLHGRSSRLQHLQPTPAPCIMTLIKHNLPLTPLFQSCPHGI